jgi:hypothetical protein
MVLRSLRLTGYFLTLLLMLIMAPRALGQESEFHAGVINASLNLGFGSDNFNGRYFLRRSPLMSGTFETGVKDGIIDKGSIGVGGMIGLCTFRSGDINNGYRFSDFIVGARGNFHYPFISKLDTYTGIMLGFDFSNSSSYGTVVQDYQSNQGPFLSWYLGARYYFSDRFAAMAEAGVGIIYLNLGISMKF